MDDSEILAGLKSGKYHIKQKTQFSKVIVLFVIASVLLFTAICLYLFYVRGIEPSSLIVAFYSFMGAEVLGLATVKWQKIKRGE